MEKISISDAILFFTLIFTIWALWFNYKQKKTQEIITYYEKTQDIREKVSNLKNRDKDGAKSLLKQNLNLYDIIAYSILKNVFYEKDAYNILWNNIKYYYEKCYTENMQLDRYQYFVKLYKRWSKWGLDLYYIKKIIIVGVILIFFSIVSFLVIT